MYIEYSYYDISSNEIEVKELIAQALKYPIHCIAVLPAYAKIVRSIIPDSIGLSCPIDYPMGILDTKSRLTAIETIIKNGIKTIDIVCPSYALCNRKYDKFREDIKLLNNVCVQNNVELRYFLEYRTYNYELLYKVAQILLDFGIATVFPSTGYLLDDINDNILATALINKKVPKINIISNGNVWTAHQVNMIQKANLYGLRVNSINALSLLSQNMTK